MTLENSIEAHQLSVQIAASQGMTKIFQDQAARLKNKDGKSSERRGFVELWTKAFVSNKQAGNEAKTPNKLKKERKDTSTITASTATATPGADEADGNLQWVPGQGRRNPIEQSLFRKDLIEAYNSRKPGEDEVTEAENELWCPAVQEYLMASQVGAAHMFSYAMGHNVMDSIFGKTDPIEFMHALNGMMISADIESFLDTGMMAIVPYLPDGQHTKAAVAEWTKQDTKEYMVKILQPKAQALNSNIVNHKLRLWKDLDGQK